MKPTHCLIGLILALIVEFVTAVSASAGVVVLKVVDQYGQEIPGSQINVLSQTVNTGDSVLLPEGTQFFLVLPGLRSAPSTTTELHRTEVYDVTAGTTAIEFEWITSTYTVRITDQHGVDISASHYSPTAGPSVGLTCGDPVTLPITDESVYPTMGGGYTDGYFVSLFPGLRGALTSSELYRYAEGPLELSAAPAEFVFEWITSTYTVRITDQVGVDIPASTFNTAGPSGYVNAGDPVTLPITDESVYPKMAGGYKDGYFAGLFPGLRGAPSSSTELYRWEGPFELSAAPAEFVFEWITSSYTLRLTDQHGVDIPASTFTTPGIPYTVHPGDTITLPITDESVYPTMNGAYRDGYFAGLLPGLRGVPSTELYRYAEGSLELSAAPAAFVFEWITSTYTVWLKDQHGVDIPASTFTAAGLPTWLNVGEPVTLPITDESVYPSMGGYYKDGYFTGVAPGLNGNPGNGNFLYRYEVNMELGTEPAEFTFEWIQHQCALEVRDAANSPVPGSDLVLPPLFPDYIPGQAVTIPINDAATYPSIGGYYASNSFGYWITVTPGDIAPASSEIYFTVSAAGDFSPGSFAIGGNSYSLAFGDCAGCASPDIESLSGPTAPVALGTSAMVSATFAAAGPGRTCAFDWGDGTEDIGIDASAATCSATHTYGAPGVYRVTVTALNECGDTDVAAHEFVVVYDPDGGFVTGGGWIYSAWGAYTGIPVLVGKANFGFVAKYQKGANIPTGNTEFQFKAAGLNFKSTSYDWLVVAGAKAKFKGSGTINGAGDFGFQLTATDGEANGGGGTDKFRIKIWDTSGGGLIYDNQAGDPDNADATTVLGGGSIVIHKP